MAGRGDVRRCAAGAVRGAAAARRGGAGRGGEVRVCGMLGHVSGAGVGYWRKGWEGEWRSWRGGSGVKGGALVRFSRAANGMLSCFKDTVKYIRDTAARTGATGEPAGFPSFDTTLESDRHP